MTCGCSSCSFVCLCTMYLRVFLQRVVESTQFCTDPCLSFVNHRLKIPSVYFYALPSIPHPPSPTKKCTTLPRINCGAFRLQSSLACYLSATLIREKINYVKSNLSQVAKHMLGLSRVVLYLIIARACFSSRDVNQSFSFWRTKELEVSKCYLFRTR